ncbi:GNAT family N-acetyltransferase [Streptacidiphilus cavernicola]|uniref:GNAT family N-acetyltransferase n=1 Tax=Streptacidiphilus cavernicola TaxID=3342716 RepID=UPI0036D2799F
MPALFQRVFDIADSGEFLPQDRDARWFAAKDEHVLTKAVLHDPDTTLIPTLSTRGKGAVKVICYTGPCETAVDLAAELAQAHGTPRARIVWFQAPDHEPAPGAGATRIQLRDFTHPAPHPGGVRPYSELPPAVAATFADFADKLSGDGFAFLHEQMKADRVGPVLTVTQDQHIVGAIGPMETGPDSTGSTRLQPQYFGVLPDQRGHGHGRRLWQAAMHWGRTYSAEYQLLQTEVGGASDRLCQAEGLTSLGFVCVRDVAQPA